MIIQIALQLALGLAALLAVYLDYKWHDKRTAIFKTGRKYLILLMICILVLSIFSTVQNERSQVRKSQFLENQLYSLKDSLYSIKQISNELSDKLDPIIEFAKNRYPTLSTEEAVGRIKNDLDSLGKKTKNLEDKEQGRREKELAIYDLKRTKPEFDIELAILPNDNSINFLIKFKNKVPIKLNFFLYLEGNSKLLVDKVSTKWPEIYPELEQTYAFTYDKLENLKYVQNKAAIIVMRIVYESIYINEVKNPELKGVIEKRYLLNVPERIIKKL